MLRTAKDIQGYTILASDGEIGEVSDLYFDDQSWTIRYLVADTGGWLAGRSVLLTPDALRQGDSVLRILPVSLTKQQIENSPPISEDQPVSRQYEAEYYDYYGYPYYWAGPYTLGPAGTAGASMAALPVGSVPSDAPMQTERGDPHLRSTKEVIGYHIQAREGEVGHVEDFLIDDETWTISHVVVDTRHWLPGKKVIVSPRSIEQVKWEESRVYVGLTQEEIKNGPEYDPAMLVDQRQHTTLYG